ncbi:MAG: zinc ribbon domain-containing protein [Clostridia bacterium]|nr:zinc ribbon domain-containing protein [Clostridia bacterium]
MKNKLDLKIEARFIALGNKRYYRALVLTAVWILLVIAAFLVFVISTERSFADLGNYLILLLCIIPFFPFSAHKILLSKSFYASVSLATDDALYDELRKAYMSNRFDVENVRSVTFEKDSGEKFTVSYKIKSYIMDGLHYEEGDRVFFVRGLKYPLKFPITEGMEFKCPVCGHTVSAEDTVCKSCRLNFADLLKE